MWGLRDRIKELEHQYCTTVEYLAERLNLGRVTFAACLREIDRLKAENESLRSKNNESR